MSTPTEVTGNIEQALQILLFNLVEGTLTHREILYEWDKLRGSDSFTSSARRDFMKHSTGRSNELRK